MRILLAVVVGLAAIFMIASEKFCGTLTCPAMIPSFFELIVHRVGTTTPPTATETASTTEKTAQDLVSKAITALTHASGTVMVPHTTTANTPGPLRATTTTTGSHTLTRAGVIVDTNAQRALQGQDLVPLSENAELDAAATAKLNDMFAKQYFAHVSPTGVGPSDVVTAAGYTFLLTGENLALGNFDGDSGVVTAWMNSPGHRANILKPGYRQIGVAVGEGIFNGTKEWIAVQEFGTPRSACPELDSALSALIDTSKAQITTTQNKLDAEQQAIQAMSPSDPSYRSAVDDYNTLVNSYNQLVIKTKELITQYNTEVQAFNTCLAGY